jgi:uncharacterized protein YbjT (DUF2867 family)
MTKVLIAGATGLVGSNLVQACKKQNKEIRALVRTESIAIPAKIDPLKAAGVEIVEGSLEDFPSLVKACKDMDVVISAVGSEQLTQQVDLIKAAKETNIQRFISSDFGIDPRITGQGSCLLFDMKAQIHQAVKDSGLNYTFIHSNGFMEVWAYSLGQVGLTGPPEEVELYDGGTVKFSITSVPDITKITITTVDDPRALNKELAIIGNIITQEELIQLWEEITGKSVIRKPVSLEDLKEVMASSNTPDMFMNLIFAQLKRSAWIRGDGRSASDIALEATELYPDIKITSIRDAFIQLAKSS